MIYPEIGVFGHMVHPLSNELKTARGKRWVYLLKSVYKDVAPVLAEKAGKIIKYKNGVFTPFDVAVLAVEHNLCFKHCCQWLEDQCVIPVGTCEKVKDRGMGFQVAMQEAVEYVKSISAQSGAE